MRPRSLSRYFIPALTLVAVLAAAWSFSAGITPAFANGGGHGHQQTNGNDGDNGNNGNGEGHTPVTLCHWVPAHGGSYITITVDDDGSSGNANLQGHAGHANDIIPAPAWGCEATPTAEATMPPPTGTAAPSTATVAPMTPTMAASETPVATATATATTTGASETPTATGTVPATVTEVPVDTATPTGSAVPTATETPGGAGVAPSPTSGAGVAGAGEQPTAANEGVLGAQVQPSGAGGVAGLPSTGSSDPHATRNGLLLASMVLALTGAGALVVTLRNRSRTR
jgi:hypothetical protein